jgi:hypothetical protein
MSVRPITESEIRQAYGEPFTTYFAVFGATQGILMTLRYQQATIQTARWNAPAAFFVLGGAALGMVSSVVFFGDAQLRRLHSQHQQDRAHNTAATKWQA